MTVVKSPTLSKTHMSFDCLYSLIVIDIEINYSRLMMPLVLSRGILLRPRSEPSNVLGFGLYIRL